ncbi:Pvc16 family protein [Microvirga splendida]|uniref:DUF4255 domain-containing protein n=1 Tax=Microvirga splendida TaxID=2795727 RepID=A0ABS0Y4E0_9HYPH|nr:Pvc16 family protein [Microvirga splendida]MBJ6127182.1 DUF4255 domain-containing protein [Microvirga splendida]
MSADKIRKVTEAIKTRIESALPDLVVPALTKVHVGPLDDQEAKNARLALFLYRASVNSDLRNAGHRVLPADPNDPIIVHDRAIPFDLHFLLTTSPSDKDTDLNALDDLGLAIQSINDTPDLVGGALGSDVVRLSFEAMPTEEMGRIWALFPAVNYRTSVVVLATPVWIDPALPARPTAPVVSEEYRATPNFQEPPNGF